MREGLEIRRVYPEIPRMRRLAEALLADCGLLPELPPYYLGVFDCEDNLVAGAGLDGKVVKCVAVRGEMRGENLVNALLPPLMREARDNGHSNVFVFTKPENRTLFESLSMRWLGGCGSAALLESDPRGISLYCDRLREIASQARGARRGVVVMNCNPLTLGHSYLLREAAARVDHLFVIPVKEDRSLFPADRRAEMLRRCCRALPNVTLCPGSDYIISSATFPTYFLKERSAASEAHIALDCDIFRRHIAPALGATVRFVGSEPTDALTRAYNEGLRRHLGMEVCEIERLALDGAPVSASELRARIADPSRGNPLRLADPASYSDVLAMMARQALVDELETTPKPGLVDLRDNGSHADMDPEVMRRGIEALTPFFAKLAEAGRQSAAISEVRRIGLEAEEAMYRATGGVNTHRGALFSLGLAVCAAAEILVSGEALTPEQLSSGISSLALGFSEPEGTHGASVRKGGSTGGALSVAKEGYRDLFASWLPAFRAFGSGEARLKTLLLIMSTLGDSNILYRGGPDALAFAQREAAALLAGFSEEGMARLNREFVSRNLSPGGSADMLSLTLFVHSITNY